MVKTATAAALELLAAELELGAAELDTSTLEAALDTAELITAELELVTAELELAASELAAALDDELLDDAGALELALEAVGTVTQSVVSPGNGFQPAPALNPAKICARLQKLEVISLKDNCRPN